MLLRNLKARLKPFITPAIHRRGERILAWMFRRDLVKLAMIFGTDKWNYHSYAARYARYFRSIRHRRLNILEIGVGGYADPQCGSRSLRMWKAYFPNSQIYGIDCYDKRGLEEPRIHIFQGRQEDPEFLRRVVQRMGRLDLVIDDGSHVSSHVIAAFETLFPLLADGGIYVIEDTQTSYWPGFGGSTEALNDPTTTMGYFKRLVDGLNHVEFLKPGYQPSYCDRHIAEIHFSHNLIVIMKGDNTEESTILRANTTQSRKILEAGASRHRPQQPGRHPGRLTEGILINASTHTPMKRNVAHHAGQLDDRVV